MAGNQLRVMLIRIIKICSEKVKLTFSEKVSKIDKIFTVNLTVDAVGSSRILKGKQKLGVTVNFDKLGGIHFTNFSKRTMCSASET